MDKISPPLPRRRSRRLHPVPIRVMHWINAAAMLVMITSGWGIYDDDVIVRGLHFPQTLWAMLAGGPRVGPSGHGEPAPLP